MEEEKQNIELNDFCLMFWLDDDERKRRDYVTITKIVGDLIYFQDRFNKKHIIPTSRVLKIREATPKFDKEDSVK